jgi:hypothetical protein
MYANLVVLSKMEFGKRRVGATSSWVSGTLEMADRPGLFILRCGVSCGYDVMWMLGV